MMSHYQPINIIKNDDVVIKEFLINNTTFFVYNDLDLYCNNFIKNIEESKETIFLRIKEFLETKLKIGEIKTINGDELIIEHCIFMIFSKLKVSVHLPYSNIIGALEIGVMIDINIDTFFPKYYYLLDDSELI